MHKITPCKAERAASCIAEPSCKAFKWITQRQTVHFFHHVTIVCAYIHPASLFVCATVNTE